MTTPCFVGHANAGTSRPCREDSHVVLFASGPRFCGIETYPGQMLVFCFAHGEQLLDVIRAWKARRSAVTPSWLADDMKADRLPRLTPDAKGWLNPQEAKRRTERWTASEFRRTPKRPAKP